MESSMGTPLVMRTTVICGGILFMSTFCTNVSAETSSSDKSLSSDYVGKITKNIEIPKDPVSLTQALLDLGKNKTIAAATTFATSLVLSVTKHPYFKNAAISKVSPSVQKAISDRLTDSFKGLSVKGLTTDIIIDFAIDVATKNIDDMHGYKIAGASWLVMKETVAATKAGITGKGNPLLTKVAFAYEQAGVLVDVSIKNVEEYKKANAEHSSAAKSQAIGLLQNYQIYEGAELFKKYKRTTSEAERKIILQSIQEGASNKLLMMGDRYKDEAETVFGEWAEVLEGKLVRSQLDVQIKVDTLIATGKFEEAENLAVASFGVNWYAVDSFNIQKDNEKTDVAQSVEKKKAIAKELRQKNKALANEVEGLLKKMTDPNTAKSEKESLSKQLEDKKKELDENAQAYLALRYEIRQSESEYGSSVDTAGTVTARVAINVQEELGEKQKEQEKELENAQAQLDSLDKNNPEKQREISDLQNKINGMERDRQSKLTELSRLESKSSQGPDQVKIGEYNAQISNLQYRLKYLDEAREVRKKMLQNNLSIKTLTETAIAHIKLIAKKLKMDWVEMLVECNSLYSETANDITELKVKLHYVERSGGLTSSEKRRLSQLKGQIENLDGDIKSSKSGLSSLNSALDIIITNYTNYEQSIKTLEGTIASSIKDADSKIEQLFNWILSQEKADSAVQEANEGPGGLVFPDKPQTSSLSQPSSGDTPTYQQSSSNNGSQWGWGSVIGSNSATPVDFTYSTPRIIGPGGPLSHSGNSTQIEVDNVNGNFSVNYNYGAYSYVAWGTWNGGAGTVYQEGGHPAFDDVDGHWVYGESLGADEIPISGSATYNGELMGGYVDHGGVVEPNSITGSMNMAVIFSNGNNSIAGSMNLLRSGNPWATTTFNSANARTGGMDFFRANMVVTGGGTGDMIGTFYGPNAEEIGGAFMVNKTFGADSGGASGVFRAKR